MNAKTIWKAILLSGIGLNCAGCLTESVQNIGVRQPTSSIRQVIVCSNNTVVIAYNVAFFPLTPHQRSATDYSGILYLVGSPEDACWAITNALKSSPVPLPQTNVVHIARLPYGQTDSHPWRLVKSYEPAIAGLPAEFARDSDYWEWVWKGFPYQVNGAEFRVYVPQQLDMPTKPTRRWYGYPAQLLIFPAIPLDVVGFPIEAYIGLKHFNQAF